MLVIKSFLFLLSYLIIAILIGDILGFGKKNNLFLTIANGVVVLWAIFEVVSLIFAKLGFKLSTLTKTFLILFIVLVIWKYFIKGKTELLKSIKETLSFPWKNNILKSIMLFLIFLQVISVSLLWHEDLDDATYVGIPVTSYYTDTINKISPDTGEEVELETFGEYALSEFPVFWAMWSQVFHIHPAILMRTILPIFLIPLSYVIYWCIGNEILEKNSEKYWFIIFVSIINLFGGFSVRSTSSFLLYRIWQGKAVLCNIVIPLYYYYYIEGRRDKRDCVWYIEMYIIVLSACMTSFSGVLIMPIIIGVCSILDLLYKEPMKNVILFGGSMISCVILGGLYIGM